MALNVQTFKRSNVQTFKRPGHQRSRAAGDQFATVWLMAWLLTFPMFTLFDFWVDQAIKEFWFALPAVAVLAAIWLLRMLDKGSGARVFTWFAWMLGAVLVWQSLSLWVFRMLFHNRL